MKKIIRKAAFVTAFALAAGYGVYSSQEAVELSDLALANVEALANFELGEGGYTRNTGQCSHPVEYKHWVSCTRGGSEDCYPSDC